MASGSCHGILSQYLSRRKWRRASSSEIESGMAGRERARFMGPESERADLVREQEVRRRKAMSIATTTEPPKLLKGE